MKAYQQLIEATATEGSPWYVVPSNNKAFARIVVASAVINTLDSLDLEFPQVSEESLEELQTIRKELLSEDE